MRRETWFPVELSRDVPCITIKGRQSIQIEQHKGLIAYQDDKIVFGTAAGRLCILGRELRFQQYSAQDALITGEISGVTMEGSTP